MAQINREPDRNQLFSCLHLRGQRSKCVRLESCHFTFITTWFQSPPQPQTHTYTHTYWFTFSFQAVCLITTSMLSIIPLTQVHLLCLLWLLRKRCHVLILQQHGNSRHPARQHAGQCRTTALISRVDKKGGAHLCWTWDDKAWTDVLDP